MMKASTLNILGYQDKPVLNTFFQQEKKSTHLAIVFPGRNYSCQKPLLYYSIHLFLALKADVLLIEYDYSKIPPKEQENRFFNDIDSICQTIQSFPKHYSQITLLGKSLGSLAMGYSLTREASFTQANVIWLTPLLRNEELAKNLEKINNPSLFIVGGADPNYNQAITEVIRKGEVVVIKDGDHNLEIEGNVFRSLEVIKGVLQSIQTFFMTNHS